MKGRVLAIEDDSAVQNELKTVAGELGMTLDSATDGRRGLELAGAGDYSLILLDLGLPSIGGSEICRELRVTKPKLPIVILTSRNDELSTVLGLELGADDYVVKPFRTAELVARIRAIFRRIEAYQGKADRGEATFNAADVSIDLLTREARKGGKVLSLSRTEFDLLAYFMQNAGMAISRDELIENVWGYACTGFDGTVTTYLSRLRQKIEDDPNNPKLLTTLRGIGYRFAAPESPE